MTLRQSSPAVYAALRERYCAPEFALFFEVANGTGSNIRRYADALAMNLFPSRGLTLNGIEVKVSRHDWQRELKDPQKVEQGIYKYCDHWWVVAPNGVVARAEMPPTWGLLEMNEKGVLRQSIAAPRLNPEPMSRNFIAALLRRASEADDSVVNALVRKQVEDRTKGIEAEIERRIKSRMREIEHKIETIEGIERQLGVSLTDYSAHEGYGRILKAINTLGVTKDWGGLRQLADSLKSAFENAERCIAEFDAMAPDVPKPKAEAA